MSYQKKPFFLALLLCLTLNPRHSKADTVLLQDGSRLHGTIERLAKGILVLDTSFAGRLSISTTHIRGLQTDGKHLIEIDSGDRVAGRLRLDKDGRQRLTHTAFGDVTLNVRKIMAIWSPDQPQPDIAQATRQHKQQLAAIKHRQTEQLQEVKADYQKRIEKLEKRTRDLENPWSGSIAFGLLGSQGNTNNFVLHGRGDAERKTDFDRLKLYIQSDLQEDNGATTVNHTLAGASLERDISRRWFTFGAVSFEKDEFENLSLRALGTGGMGYFFIRRPHFEWKGLAGIGYQHASYTDGTIQARALLSLGYDLRYDYDSWLTLKHSLTIYPTFTDPARDYRLVSDFIAESPLVKGEPWKVQLRVRNKYNPLPVAGAKSLDTTYSVNLAYDWK